ncbi:Ig-like domain-containing protein [Leptothrix discophora]|uniref:Ig-like domain-containing protein n=1 Tax=Leptothrix discophora TaxID=89 RepID=A0ABT9G3D5_LEPDI|nr:Ig-like domain-containing protein [Leptothrix discophora]MDP4300996.1 Ig-like domain-containing protein [Leptothrix discophora]
MPDGIADETAGPAPTLGAATSALKVELAQAPAAAELGTPGSVGEDLLRQALPPAAPRPAPRPPATPAGGDAGGSAGGDDAAWYESTPLLLGAAAVGVLALASGAKSPAPAPAPAPTSPDYLTFRVLPMAGEMTGLRVVVVDADGQRQVIDPANVLVANPLTGELKVTVTQFGKLAAGARLKIELHDDNGSAANFDDETNPVSGYDTDLGATVLSAWISKAPVASNELAHVSGSTMSLAVTPLTTVASRHIDGLLVSHPELFADAAKADETIAAIHQSVAALFSSLGSFPLVQNAQPKPVNADWTASPDAYGKALAVLSKMATWQETTGLDGVIDYLARHLQDDATVGRGVTLDAAASLLLQTVSNAYFADADVSAAIQANLASVSLRRRNNASSTIGEQVDAAGVIAYTSLTDGLTVAITPAKGARAGDNYTLRFHPDGTSGSARDYTVNYTLPSDYDAASTTLPLLFKVPVFRDNLAGQEEAPLVEFAPDVNGRTLLSPDRAPAEISRFKLTIEPGPGMKPDFVLPAVDLAIDHAPVAIVSAPETAGATRYHVGETILVKVVLPSKVAWNVTTNGVDDVRTYAPKLRFQVGTKTVEAILVDPVAANGGNELVFGYLVTKASELEGEISVGRSALVTSGGSTSIRDVSGGLLTRAFSLLVDTTLDATGQGVDALAPVAPSLTLQAASNTGAIGDNITGKDVLVFDVAGEALSRVVLADALGAAVGSVVLDENGRGVLTTRALANTNALGTVHTLTATAFDDAGNESVPSPGISMLVDTRAPAQPSARVLELDDTGISAGDGITRQTVPTVRIVGEAGAQVVVFVDTNGDGRLDPGEFVQGRGQLKRLGTGVTVPGLVLTSDQGYLDLALTTPDRPLADGTYALTAVTTDAAGNDSPAFNMQPLQVISQIVAAPVLTIATTAPESGYLTVGSKVRITATFERAVHVEAATDPQAVGPHVSLRLNATTVVSALLVSGSGTRELTFEYTVGRQDNSPGLSIDASALSLGAARLTDVAGNDAGLATQAVAASAAAPLRIDTLAPVSVVSAVLDAGSDTGKVGDGKTGENTPNFAVEGEGGATVVLFNDEQESDTLSGNVELGRVVLGDVGAASARGVLSLNAGQVLADGTYKNLKVVQIDAAGNVSPTKRVRGSSEVPELVISTDRPGQLTDLEFDEAMDRLSVAGAGLAPRDYYTYIATPTFNFKGGENNNTAILFRDVNGNGRLDRGVDVELGRSTISTNYRSVSVAAVNALSEGVYENLRVVQESSSGVLADEASALARSVRISPNEPGPLGISLKADQTYGNASQIHFDLTASSHVPGARVVVFDDRNLNGQLDDGDVRLGSAAGDLPAVVANRPVLSLAAPTEGSYAHLMAYQVYAGKSGAASAVGGVPNGGITLDRTGPGLTISSDVFVLNPGAETRLLLTFDEEPRTGTFTLDLLKRTDDRVHAKLGELSAIVPVQLDNRTVWQASVTLTADATGITNFTLDAPAGAYVDRYGNASQASHFELSGVSDVTPPVVSITSDATKVGLAGREASTQALLTFRMSEPVTDFTLADIAVYGGAAVGSLSDLRPVDGGGLAWTAVFTPASSTLAEARITVRNGAVFDTLGGNANAAASIRLSVDTAAAPVLVAPDAWADAGPVLRVLEDTRLPLRATAANSGPTALSVRDADLPGSDSAFDRVELSVGRGLLKADLSGGAHAIGNDSATLTLTGTTAQVNAALATLSYIGTSHASGEDRLVVTARDLTGKTDRREWVLAVDAVNDAPVLTVPANGASTYVAGRSEILTGIRVDDVDSASLRTVVSVGHGTLTATKGSGQAELAGLDSAELTMSGALVDIQAALATLHYTADGDYHALNPGDTSDTVRIVTTDLEGLTISRSYTVGVTPRPVVAPEIQLSQALVEGGISTLEDVVTSPLGTGQITLSDADPDGSASALASLSLSVGRGTLTVRHAGSTLSGSALTLTGNAQTLHESLATLTYADLVQAHGDGELTLVARDADGHESKATVALHVASVGDAPVIGLPAAPNGLETGKTSSLTGIRVSDVDVGVGALRGVTVSVQHGALKVTLPTAASPEDVLPVVTGQGGSSLSFAGTQAQMQSLLDTLTYTPDDGVLPRPEAQMGRDVLTVTATDGDDTTPDPSRELALSVLVPNKPATGDIGVQGMARVGNNLTISNTLADPDGIAGGQAGMAYTWLRDGVPIGPAAVGRTYEVTDADLHHALAVGVRFTDLRGEVTQRTSVATAPVESDLALGLAAAIEYANNTRTPASSAQLILSRHGDGYEDYVLDVNRDGAIGAEDRTAYISSLSVNSMLTLADGRSARLLSSDDWAAVTGVPADWPLPGADGAGYWTSTPGDEGTHLVHLGAHTLTTPHPVVDSGGMTSPESYFNVFRVEQAVL